MQGPVPLLMLTINKIICKFSNLAVELLLKIIYKSSNCYVYFLYSVDCLCNGSQECWKSAKVMEFYDLNPAIFHKITLNSNHCKIAVFDVFP